MTYPVECQRLRAGGTISGSSITGGTLLETSGTNLLSLDGLLSVPGRDAQTIQLSNRDGALTRIGGSSSPGKLWRPRLMTLQLVAFDRDADGSITDPDGRCAELESNLDLFAELLLASEDLIVLERDMADGSTRFIELEFAGSPVPLARGPVFGPDHSSYAMLLPMRAPWPFWQSETEFTEPVTSGAGGTITNLGTAPIGNAQLEFAGDSILGHTEYGAQVTVAGSAGPVVVDLRRGRSRITESGIVDAGAARRNRGYWMRFPVKPSNVSTLTATAATVTVRYRWQYLI